MQLFFPRIHIRCPKMGQIMINPQISPNNHFHRENDDARSDFGGVIFSDKPRRNPTSNPRNDLRTPLPTRSLFRLSHLPLLRAQVSASAS